MFCGFKKKLEEEKNASLLCEMQSQKRNEKSQGNHDEKRQAGYPGCVSNLRDQDVQDRQKQIGSLWPFARHRRVARKKLFPA
jgi:hypothetical protein